MAIEIAFAALGRRLGIIGSLAFDILEMFAPEEDRLPHDIPALQEHGEPLAQGLVARLATPDEAADLLDRHAGAFQAGNEIQSLSIAFVGRSPTGAGPPDERRRPLVVAMARRIDRKLGLSDTSLILYVFQTLPG